MTQGTPVASRAPDGSSTDADLLAASVFGDLAAFAHLVARHQQLVCAIAFSTVGDRALSEDVTQETLLALWKARDRIREPNKLSSWLCNTARNLGRKAMRGRHTVALDAEHDVAIEVTMFDQLAERQEQTAVWSALAAVSETYREPLVLFYRDGKSMDRVATALGVSRDAAKQRVARGRTELKDRLELVERHLARTGPKAAFTAAVTAAIGAHSATAHAAVGGGSAVGRWWSRRRVMELKRLVGVVIVVTMLAIGALLLWPTQPELARSAVAGQLGKSAPSAHQSTPSASLPATQPDPAGTLRLEGLVIDDTGNPVADAIVSISTTPPTFVRSDDGGSFTIPKLLPRIYRLAAHRNDLVSQSFAVLVTETTEPVVLELRRGATLDVTVLDELSGRPLSGASVSILRAGDRTAQLTDEQGKARIAGVVEATSLEVRARGFGIDTRWIDPPADGFVFRQTFYLEPGRSVAGIVRDRAGRPVAGATIVPSAARRSLGSEMTTSDATGAWQMADLPRSSYVFYAFAPTSGHGRSGTVDLTMRDELAPVVLVVEPGLMLGGRVADARGQSVPLARVELEGRAMNADAQGRFVFRDVPPGPVELFATRYPDSSALETIVAGVDRDDLVLTIRPSVIRGVVKRHGEPVAGVQVTATSPPTLKNFDPRTQGISAHDVTNAAGEFVLGPLPDDNYWIRADRPGHTRVPGDLPNDAQAQTRPNGAPIVLELPTGGGLRGTLVREDGGRVDALMISFAAFKGGLAFATPQPVGSGTFHFENLPTSTRELAITGDGVAQYVRTDLQISAGQTTDLGTITLPAGGALEGQVVTPRGAPVPNAVVVAEPVLRGDDRAMFLSAAGAELAVAMGTQLTRTDGDGRFRLTGLSDRAVIVMADSRVLGRSQAVETLPGRDGKLVLIVEPIARLAGQITRDGQPVASATVTVSASKSVSFETTTDELGHYDFVRLGAGTYALTIRQSLGLQQPEAIKPEVVVAAGSEVRHDIELDGNGMRLEIELELGSVQLIGAVMLIPEQVSASSLAELEKLASTQAKSQSLVTAHGRTTIEFLAVTPGNYTVCTVLANSPSTIADPRAITPTVGCSSAVVATSPRAQRVSITPRLPN